MAYEQLIVDRRDAVAVLRMNNPARLNALSETLTKELLDGLTSLGADPECRAIVLTGEGRGFSAGADLTALKDPYLRGERPRPSRFLEEGYNRLIPLLVETPKPVIAAVNGVVAGAGCSVALACDLRLASEEASFSLAFVRIGLIPDAGSTFLLPRAVGAARALELALLSDRLDARGALEMGLVNRVVPHGDLMDEAVALASRLSALPTVAIGLTKRILQESSRLTLHQALDREAEVQDQAAATNDHVEGVLAFLEKRPPSFTGT